VRVMITMGTRPEAIKLAPVVRQLLATADAEVVMCTTGQHREMLTQVLVTFGLQPDHQLNLFEHGQSLAALTAKAVESLSRTIAEVEPDVTVVQGDTTSTFGAALASYYADIPVAHVEAGLRTSDPRSPYPEEMNRRLTTRLASLHLAPTQSNKRNLVEERVHAGDIVVTGNTVIDALLWAAAVPGVELPEPLRQGLDSGRPVLLVTAHRRESWGAGMRSVGAALDTVARQNPDWLIVFPIHRNPVVRRDILTTLGAPANVLLVEPLGYLEFAQLLSQSRIVLTDSGGIQEEAPSLGKPVLVLRDNTERPEAVEAGTVRLVGTMESDVVKEVQTLIDNEHAYEKMARAVNPYGDGSAAERVMGALQWRFLGGPRPQEFRP
jgi:UDP-N-acetylglucosamine 2-epimerase (non-hydrolysing)